MEIQSGEFRKTLSHLSKHIDSSTLEDLKYLSQDVIGAAKLEKIVSPLDFFRALEECGKISVKDASYLADLLEAEKKYYLAEKLAPFKGDHYTTMHRQPATLNQLSAPMVPSSHYHNATAPPFGDHRQQQTHYDDTRYAPGSLSTVQSSHNSVQVQNQQVISTPTQVENDDNETGAVNQLEQVRDHRGNLESLRGPQNDTIYQSKRRKLEERELQYKRELEDKDKQLQQHQKQLQDREDTINQLTRQHEQQLHVLRQVKTDSASEQERLQQQIREYEEMIRQNHSQIEALREENAQVPAPFGPAAEKYPMIKKPHGIAVIINNFEFFTTDPSDEVLQNRRGSQVDEKNLCVTWEYLQYDVRILRNLTASELTRQLMQIALQSHENYDSFVCCILSHGYLDGVYGADGKPVNINDITSLFKGNGCPTLSDKPKLFFIQACRGDDEDKGVSVQQDARGNNEDLLRRSLPSEADFLFGYATPPGNVSFRSPQYGTWYISKLCEVLKENSPQQDLLSMLTMVNSKVSEAYTNKGYKQCPAPVTLLRKQVWFFNKC